MKRQSLLVILFLAIATSACFAGPHYQIVDLAPLPGGFSSGAIAINSHDEVIGWSLSPTSVQSACLWTPEGQPIDLRANATALDISDRGIVVGYLSGNDGQHACYWINGAIRDLNEVFSKPGWTLRLAYAISNNGALNNGKIVGIMTDTQFHCAGFIADLRSKTLQNAWASGAKMDYAYTDTNSSGTMSGVIGNRATVWTAKGAACDLGIFSSYDRSYASKLNEKDQVIGNCLALGNHYRGLFASPQGVKPIVPLLGMTETLVSDINNYGAVVGKSWIVQNTYVTQAAFVWYQGVLMLNLNDVSTATSQWRLEDATGINDRFTIVGSGTVCDGGGPYGFSRHAYKAVYIGD